LGQLEHAPPQTVLKTFRSCGKGAWFRAASKGRTRDK
jgi:hypothetical protein